MNTRESKQERVAIINRIILEIASRGSQTFLDKETGDTAYFSLENRLFFYDHKGKRIYPYMHITPAEKIRYGGTMWALINDFRHFIMTGEKCDGKNGYGGLYCTHWGYPPKDMEAIQMTAKELGYLV